MIFKSIFLSVCILVLANCGGGGSDTGQPVNPPAQENRILGMGIIETPSITYSTAYDEAVTLGVREMSVSLDWSEIEPTVGNYDDTYPNIIETYYPIQTGDLTIVLRPLDTAGPRLPADLSGMSFSNPVVISAFENLLTHLHSKFTTLNASGKLKIINIGNEIDSSLGSDPAKWSEWQIFFMAAKAKVISLWGSNVEVASIIQSSALNDFNKRNLYLNLLSEFDNAVLTYYPLNSDFTVKPLSAISSDFDFIVNTIQNKPIIFQECGFPSSAVNGSTEALQADFITEVMNAWDTHRDRIKLIDFAWQYDVSEATADKWVVEYGMAGQANENEFKFYLWTLGLGNYDSTEKPAIQRLRDELNKRSWE